MGCLKHMILRDLLGLMPPSHPKVLGGYYRDAGAYVEALIAPHIGRLLGTHVDTTFQQARTGVDIRHSADDGSKVIIEVKSAWVEDRDVKEQLHYTKSGQQMSDSWLSAHHENPDDSYKVIVQVNMVTETANVYLMTGEPGWNKDPVLEVPLGEFHG